MWRAIRWPAAAAVANALFWPFLFGYLRRLGYSGEGWKVAQDSLFIGIRLTLMAWAVARTAMCAEHWVRKSGIAATSIVFVDHVLVKGGLFIVSAIKSSTPVTNLHAFYGVLATFIIASPIAFVFGIISGKIVRHLCK
jgi:hypothetical protein